MFKLLVEAVEDYSIFLLSPDGVVSSWNRGAERIKGYGESEILGKSFSVFFTAEDRAGGVPELILREAHRHGRYETEGWRVRKDGSRFWARATLNAVTDDEGSIIGFAKITRDVTVARETSRALRTAALTDPLTGMWNRVAFLDELDQWVENDETFAVSIIDLNGFKLVNDSLGHAAGDALLKSFAEHLHAAVSEGIIAARLGGDEFAAAARTPEPHSCDDFVEMLTAALRKPVMLGSKHSNVSASVGVACFPSDAKNVSELLARADAAMYEAKETQSETAVMYREGLLKRSASRRVLDREIVGAIGRDEFELQYQVQTSLKDGAVVGREALVRWNHPVLGLLHPGEFISLAEANGTIVELGRWVLGQACADAAAWSDRVRVAVNVSALQLADPDFATAVADALTESGLAPHRLELEITEATLISRRSEVVEIFAALQGLGVKIALDDFGTGFSSLDTLLAFAFDRIKIDRSVLHASLQPSRTRSVLRAILALGHALTTTVLVEGVETQKQLELLRGEGFDEVQGFLTGRPAVNAG
jgi:diguanylate cyclase (GGDEF)-like protein/PAS domain S-box-containing protein